MYLGGHDGLHEFEYMVATVHVILVVSFQPLGKHLAILLVSIDKTGVARVAEQMPLAVGDMLIERGCYNGGTDVACATTDKCRLRNLV